MVRKERRLSDSAAAVLRFFLANPDAEFYGLEILERTGIASGTLYPMLIRLEENGFLRSGWEQVDETVVGRPKRRYYRLNPSGQEKALHSFSEWSSATLIRRRLLGALA